MPEPKKYSNGSIPPSVEARLKARERPDGSPVMHQSWDKLLFLHWKVPIDILRPLIPEPLAIDTFDGEAWISITPLTIFDARPVYVPALPYLSRLHELNVRTYVHLDGWPGVWFFSLDANNSLAVLGARTFFDLPYFNASITMELNDNTVKFDSKRDDGDGTFTVQWTIGPDRQPAEPGSLDFFLLERYCLYTSDGGVVSRCRIHHETWPLQITENLAGLRSTMASANGLPEPGGEPVLHCGGPVHVEVWAPEKVFSATS